MPHMYILECADGTFYTGSTRDLQKRLLLHQNGKGARYTRQRLPVTLRYSEEFTALGDAMRREKQVQRWTHSRKQALIDGGR